MFPQFWLWGHFWQPSGPVRPPEPFLEPCAPLWRMNEVPGLPRLLPFDPFFPSWLSAQAESDKVRMFSSLVQQRQILTKSVGFRRVTLYLTSSSQNNSSE